MPLTPRDFAVATAAFGLAVLTLHQGGQPQPQIKIQPRVLSGPAATLSNAQKMKAALTQLKLTAPLKGVRSLVTLTPNQPVVTNVAQLSLHNPLDYTTSMEPGKTGVMYGYGEDSRTAPYNLGMEVIVSYLAARPNTVHVVTFYVDPGGIGETLTINGLKVPISGEKQAIPMAQISGPKGGVMTFHPEKRQTVGLYKVEIDVLD